jgi:hypothetical protein
LSPVTIAATAGTLGCYYVENYWSSAKRTNNIISYENLKENESRFP